MSLLFFEDRGLIAGQGPKPTQAATKASSANPPAQKPAAYRPPHAKTAAVIQAQVHTVTIYGYALNCHCFYLNCQYKLSATLLHGVTYM